MDWKGRLERLEDRLERSFGEASWKDKLKGKLEREVGKVDCKGRLEK